MARTKNAKDIKKRARRGPHSARTIANVARGQKARHEKARKKNYSAFLKSLCGGASKDNLKKNDNDNSNNNSNDSDSDNSNNDDAAQIAQRTDTNNPILPADEGGDNGDSDDSDDGSSNSGHEGIFETWASSREPREVQCEAEERNPSIDFFMNHYLRAIVIKLQSETKKTSTLEFSLVDHLKTNGWWIRNIHAKSICRKLKISFQQKAYYKDVFVWLPDIWFGPTSMPSCPTCRSNEKVAFHGYRSKHFGRRIVSLHTNYFTISRRYICYTCKAAAKDVMDDEEEKEQYTFMGWNDTSLALMPFGNGDKYPAFHTRKCGVDKEIIDLMLPLFDSSSTPTSFAKMILELHSKHFFRSWINFEHETRRIKQSAVSAFVAPPTLFSEFSDRSGYDGYVPDYRYFREVYCIYISKLQDYFDAEVKKRPATIIAKDASFKVGKHLYRLKGEPLFPCLQTGLNELGECRIQYKCVSDNLEQQSLAIDAFIKTRDSYGHPKLKLMCVDNPSAVVSYYEKKFPELKAQRQQWNRTFGDSELDDISNMPTCTMHRRDILVGNGRDFVERIVSALVIKARKFNTQYSMKMGIGLDAEWVTHNDRRSRGRLSLIQIAFNDDNAIGGQRCVLIRCNQMRQMPASLSTFLASADIVIYGVGVSEDLNKIKEDLQCSFQTSGVDAVNYKNLGKYARSRGVVKSGVVGLQELVKLLYSEHLTKDPMIRISNWEAQVLSHEQIVYAALDAVYSLKIGLRLRDMRDLNQRLTKVEAVEGTDVDIVPSHGDVICMARIAAIGKIIGATTCNAPSTSKQGVLKASTKTSCIVRIEKVLATNFHLPRVKNCDGKKACLLDYGPPPFNARFNFTMLRKHVNDDAGEIAGNDSGNVPDNEESAVSAELQKPLNDKCTVEGDEYDVDLFPEMSGNGISEIDDEAISLEPMLTENDVDYLIQALRMSDAVEEPGADGDIARSNLLECSELGVAPDPNKIQNIFSAVLGDIFHYIDRAKISRLHDVRKLYKVALRNALLAWEPKKLRQVKDALRVDGRTEKDIEKELMYNSKFFRDCVERCVLPPKQLYWRVRVVFVLFGNIKDSKTDKPLFNTAAWGKATNILQDILKGYMSDPPGISFYTLRLGDNGTVLKNKHGFHLLDCHRGTNRTENYHMTMIKKFGTNQSGARISDALLCVRRHRHNHDVSVRRRPNFPDVGHYDTWLIDKVQILCEQNHGVLHYPGWSNSSDYKQTDERIGTVPIQDEELTDAVNAIVLDEEIKLSIEYKYQAKMMGVKLPFLPIVHKEEEYLFADFSLKYDFEPRQWAISWCKHVNGEDIFPKLPIHLTKYRTKCENNQRARTKGNQISDLTRKIEELNLTTMNIACNDRDKLTDKGVAEDRSCSTKQNEESTRGHNNDVAVEKDLPQNSGVSPLNTTTDITHDDQLHVPTTIVVPTTIAVPPLFLQPLMPEQMPVIPDVARHGLEVTQFGAIAIRRGDFIPTKPNVYRGKRGKDKKKRKRRLCRKCKTMNDTRIMLCKGGSGKGCCQFYKLSDDGKIVCL